MTRKYLFTSELPGMGQDLNTKIKRTSDAKIKIKGESIPNILVKLYNIYIY